MTKNEWLDIGYQNNVIDDLDIIDLVEFKNVYHSWLMKKISINRPQSVDRIECTYKRYFANQFFYLSDVDELYISNFINRLLLDYNIYTKELYRIIQIFKEVMSYAIDYGYKGVREINFDKVKRNINYNNIYRNNKLQHSISSNDISTFIESILIKNIYPSKRSAALALCANFYMGMRIGELSCLTWNDIDFENRVIHVTHTYSKSFVRDENGNRLECQKFFIQDNLKTIHSFRDIPIVNECMYILQELKKHHNEMGYNSPYICYDGSDIVLFNSVERTLKRVCKLCGMQHINSHLIRKSVATTLHNNGVPTKYISDLLGHSDIATTERYYILSTGNSKELRNLMTSALSVNLNNKKGQCILS